MKYYSILIKKGKRNTIAFFGKPACVTYKLVMCYVQACHVRDTLFFFFFFPVYFIDIFDFLHI